MAIKMSPQATRKFYSQKGRTRHNNIQMLTRFQKQEEQRNDDRYNKSYEFYEKRARKQYQERERRRIRVFVRGCGMIPSRYEDREY